MEKKKQGEQGSGVKRERISKEMETMGKKTELLLPLAIISQSSALDHTEMEQDSRELIRLQICFSKSIFP